MQVVRGLGRHLELQEAAKRQKQMQREREQVHTTPRPRRGSIEQQPKLTDFFVRVLLVWSGGVFGAAVVACGSGGAVHSAAAFQSLDQGAEQAARRTRSGDPLAQICLCRKRES